MRISYVSIENFRNFRHLEVELGQNIVMVGENRAGKSNFIYALRLVLDPTLSARDRYLQAQDFWDGEEPFKGREIKITIRLTDFADPENPEMLPLSWLSNCLIQGTEQPTAQLTYIYYNDRNHDAPDQSTFEDYEYKIFPGDDHSQSFEQIHGMRRNIPLETIDALRDIAGDTRSWRRSPLRRLIELSEIKADLFEPSASKIQTQNEEVRKLTPVSKLQAEIEGEFNEMVGEICASMPSLSLSSITASELLRSLTLHMDGDKRRDVDQISLGLQNALYLALLSLLLDKQETLQAREKQPFLPLVALEEPEAHLHPHLQRLIFNHFLDKARKRKQPVIISTHSPHLATTADVRDIVLFRDLCSNGACAVSAYTTLSTLSPRERKDLSRFLDITKAEMLFAKGVIFVEGDVEVLLITEFADLLGVPLDRLGISVCNVVGVHFSHVVMLANKLNIPFVLLSDGDKHLSVDGVQRVLSLGEIFPPERAKHIQSLHDDGQDVNSYLKEQGVFLNSWTLEVDLIEAGNSDVMKTVFEELGGELGVQVRAGITHVDRYVADPSDENMQAVLTAIDDSRWGKGRYAHRLVNQLREKAATLDSEGKRARVPQYIRASLEFLKFQIEQTQGDIN